MKCIRFEIILYRNSQQVNFVRCQHIFLGYTNMVFLNFLKPYCKDGLPDLRGNLFTEVPSRAYAQVSQEVQQTLASQKCQVGKQTGYVQEVWLHSVQIRCVHNSVYCFTRRYDPKIHLQIACYASLHGISTAATWKLGQCVWTYRINCINSAYQDYIRKIRVGGSFEPLDSLQHKKHGRPVLIGEKLDGILRGSKNLMEVSPARW